MRHLRITTHVQAAAPAPGHFSLDAIDNPNRLAHALLNLDALREEQHFSKRLRMSAIHNICLRQAVLGFRHEILTTRKTDQQFRVTFDIGNSIHEFFQNHPDYFGSRRVGWWKCTACEGRQFGKFPRQNCQRCGAKSGVFRYDEHYMRLSDPLVSGHPDMFLEFGPGDIRVAEFKTMNGPEFAELTAPKGDHVIQATGYMTFLQKDTTLPVRVNPRKAVAIYVSKKHEAKTFPLKAFHIERDEAVVRYLENSADTFTRGIRDPEYLPPPLAACVDTQFTKAVARNCPLKDRCMRCL